jgi:hypothetical protein
MVRPVCRVSYIYIYIYIYIEREREREHEARSNATGVSSLCTNGHAACRIPFELSYFKTETTEHW